MIVTRWQAPVVPDRQQMKLMFEAEGLTPYEEEFPAATTIPEHRHPFDEVRMIAEGQMILDIAGNKLLLRPGDKIVIPSNTKHSKRIDGAKCVSICAQKAF